MKESHARCNVHVSMKRVKKIGGVQRGVFPGTNVLEVKATSRET